MRHQATQPPAFRHHRWLLLTVVVMALAAPLGAQCPDGSEPPCNSKREVPRPKQRLSENMWLVLPFENTRRSPDLDWLSNASVQLLSTDLLRWKDVRVVDDERITDLLRGLPDSARDQLGLASGLRIAKEAGAGKLVMGDFLREGTRVSVTAKIYDVRTGQRERTVAETPVSIDSIAALYRSLAPRVVNLPIPAGATLAGLGTSSMQALRAFNIAVEASNNSLVDTAIAYFTQAVTLDSTFSMAHARLASEHLRRANGFAAAAAAWNAAMRHAVNLPERERIVISLKQPGAMQPNYTCPRADRLIALDSADAEGWYYRGQCKLGNFHVSIDDNGVPFRVASLNDARAAFTRSLELVPTRAAFSALNGLYSYGFQRGCPAPDMYTCPPNIGYWAVITLEHDTLATRYERVDLFDPPWRRRTQAPAIRNRIAAGRDLAAQWSAANPGDIGSRQAYASHLMQMGDLTSAKREFMTVRAFQRPAIYEREIDWRHRHAREVAAFLDSFPTASGPMNLAFGRLAAGHTARSVQDRPLAARFNRVYLGIVDDEFVKAMQEWCDADTNAAHMITDLGVTLAFNTLRRRPADDTAHHFPLFRFQAFLALGDSLSARRALAEYDRWGRARADNYWDAYEMFAAESYAQLGDTSTAWNRIELFGTRWTTYGNMFQSYLWGDYLQGMNNAMGVTGRAWLLYADLAAATGHRDQARRGYQMIVDMWEHADPVVQPLFLRAKDALALLSTAR